MREAVEKRSGPLAVGRWVKVADDETRLVVADRSLVGRSRETKGKACAADQRTRMRSKMRLAAAGHREVGEAVVADVVGRQSVQRVEEDQVVARRTAVQSVALAYRRRLEAVARSSRVLAAAAPCCHFASGRDCGFDCATECEDCDCDCGSQLDFHLCWDLCWDSDCDCGCCYGCCDHTVR